MYLNRPWPIVTNRLRWMRIRGPSLAQDWTNHPFAGIICPALAPRAQYGPCEIEHPTIAYPKQTMFIDTGHDRSCSEFRRSKT
jgi:hypothetical protein